MNVIDIFINENKVIFKNLVFEGFLVTVIAEATAKLKGTAKRRLYILKII